MATALAFKRVLLATDASSFHLPPTPLSRASVLEVVAVLLDPPRDVVDAPLLNRGVVLHFVDGLLHVLAQAFGQLLDATEQHVALGTALLDDLHGRSPQVLTSGW